MEWQDMKNAPRDGTLILLFRSGWVNSMTIGFWHKEYEEWWSGSETGRLFMDPTHWMPLPKPPSK